MAKSTRKKSRRRPAARDHYAVFKYSIWAVLAGGWLLLAASLISHDPMDAPAHAVGVHNEHYANWIGHVGAMISYKAYTVIGPGVWVYMLAQAVFLIALASGQRVNQLALRAIGVLVMTVTASAIVGLFQPAIVSGFHGGPEGAGGLVALFINDQLTTRFAIPGTIVILMIGFWIGAVLAADRYVLAVPRIIGAVTLRVIELRPPKLQLAGLVPRFSIPWRRLRVGVGGAAKRKVPLRSSRSRQQEIEEDDDDAIDERAGGFAATQSFDPEDEDDGYEDEYEDEEGYDEEYDDEAAAAKKFDPDELRAKIKKLPINFAPRATKTAPPPREVDLSGYEFPNINLLEEPESDFTDEMEAIVREQAVELESALQQYKIEGEVVGIDSGPVITLFEVRLAPGTKVSRLSAVGSDLARALRAHNIRIVPNMAGKDTVGIEVPNLKKERVRLRELMGADADTVRRMTLPMFLAKDASGNPLIADLAAMPHMLIAGTTGSGKSVCINAIIMSFLYTRRPDELKLILVDPKMVEMSMFRDIPHLMCPVVTEMPKAASILEWAMTKMDERYELLAEAGVRDIAGYNDLGWDEIKDRMEPATEEEAARIPKKLPYLVFIIDELADMIITHKEVESSIVRIAQKARAVGIHLIVATQRPQANVVTGLIKSNMPCRISFKVASGMDSRIVLDQKGGELLLGQGDMLFLHPRTSKLARAQGCLVDDMEIRRTVKFLKGVSQQSFEPSLVQIRGEAGDGELSADRDPLFDEAVEVVLETQRGSVSLLQRRLTIGYSRASRLIEQMEAAGILGSHKTAQAREVLIGVDEWEAIKAQAQADAQAGLADDDPDSEEQDSEEDDGWEEVDGDDEEDEAEVDD